MQCVILAGGLGTRMGAWTDRIPKALIPVGGRPFAEWQMAWLAAEGVTEVVYSIGYRGAMIRDVLQRGGRWGVPITYVDEGGDLRGTAGALRLAADLGVLRDSFFVVYGDSYLPVRLGPVWSSYADSGKPALMTVFRNLGRWDKSNVIYVDGEVTLYDKRYDEPPTGMVHIDYGLSVLSRSVVRERVPLRITADLADLFHGLSVDGALAGHEVSERFYEIGSPQGLIDLEAHLAGSIKARDEAAAGAG